MKHQRASDTKHKPVSLLALESNDNNSFFRFNMSSSHCHSNCVSAGNCWCSWQLHEANYIWTIENYSQHEEKASTRLKSPSFSSPENDKCHWHLIFKPNGDTDEKNTVSLFLYLNIRSTSSQVYAKYGFSILNTKHEEVWSMKFEYRKFDNSEVESESIRNDDDYADNWGWSDFLKKDEFFKNELLADNKLIISFKVTFFDIDDENTCKKLFHRCSTASLQHLSDNLASVLENSNFADVVLSTEHKDYLAHKVILAARSPVFAAMFQNGTKENQQNRVEIIDLNGEVVEEMLRYIYTGKCGNIDTLADGVLAAADKYDLNPLKIICEESLLKGLSIENAPNMLVLSDMYRVNGLKSKVIEFIVEKSSEVMYTTNWNDIMPSYPQLLNEVCLAFAHRFAPTVSGK